MLQKNLELQQQEECYYREGLTQKEMYQFQVNMDGFKGEAEVYQLLVKYGNANWIYLHDIWINTGGTTQLDLVVLTGSGVYIIDAKNYATEYVHQNQQAFANGKLLSKSIFIQLERSMEKVNLLFNNLRYNGEIQGKIVFVNPEGLIRLDEPASEVGMNRAEFIHWIKGIARDEQNLPLANILPIALKERILNEFQIENPYPPVPKSMKEIKQMKRGIKCAKCHSFDITLTMYKVICNQCGHHEVKKKSVVRTLCEYGLIRYREPLTVSECEVFLDGQVSKKYIACTLSKYFRKVNSGRYATYANKNRSFECAFENVEFPFKNSKAK